MLTVLNGLLMSRATAIAHSAVFLRLKHVAMVLFMLCSGCRWNIVVEYGSSVFSGVCMMCLCSCLYWFLVLALYLLISSCMG